MDLDEYLWKMRLKKKEFCRLVGTEPTNLYYITKRKHTPNLGLALRINYATSGEVTMEDLLTKESYEVFSDFKKNLDDKFKRDKEKKNES